MRLVSGEDCCISPSTESIVAKDSVDGVDTSSWGRNMPRGAQKGCERASEHHCDTGQRRSVRRECEKDEAESCNEQRQLSREIESSYQKLMESIKMEEHFCSTVVGLPYGGY